MYGECARIRNDDADMLRHVNVAWTLKRWWFVSVYCRYSAWRDAKQTSNAHMRTIATWVCMFYRYVNIY